MNCKPAIGKLYLNKAVKYIAIVKSDAMEYLGNTWVVVNELDTPDQDYMFTVDIFMKDFEEYFGE